MDAFLLALENLCSEIMPVLGAACLICLIVLLIKLIRMIGNVDATLLKTHGTIDLVDKSIEKVQTPLDTVAKVSTTVDKAHDATLVAAREAKDFISKNAGEIKDKVVAIINETSEKEDELREPDPEDIIGE
ncbi:MAG: hypothetical protein IKS69_06925 [Erysipelotrichaceae bacterium]|nr:hypothetical protein [Erysipelotrichaceae bacterium]MBR4422248.1 hypothetical protein [Erysipelotrichaceae bacterium]MBR5754378.1 hypothetical protein [Erysipelotrichaceae bacterium]